MKQIVFMAVTSRESQNASLSECPFCGAEQGWEPIEKWAFAMGGAPEVCRYVSAQYGEHEPWCPIATLEPYEIECDTEEEVVVCQVDFATRWNKRPTKGWRRLPWRRFER